MLPVPTLNFRPLVRRVAASPAQRAGLHGPRRANAGALAIGVDAIPGVRHEKMSRSRVAFEVRLAGDAGDRDLVRLRADEPEAENTQQGHQPRQQKLLESEVHVLHCGRASRTKGIQSYTQAPARSLTRLRRVMTVP